ncbi:cupin domain-containing protein [Undibacter mobilis]|uniref:Cupin domain-containing protein n=1 Tax=Undibacter mobilis TaxID=2292256 RepID=A0A371B2U7_9BRAD|nr:cupin domain-containing protein [Undibacter mobilis]
MKITSGVRPANEGIEGKSWNILGQTYVPKQVTESSFTWHATLPPDSFVPRHIHDTQDEFIYLIEGNLEFVIGADEAKGGPGDLVSLPKGIPHSIHNRSGKTVKCVFWVSPTRMLYDYFGKISGLTDPAEVERLAGEHEVPFVK